MEEHLRALGGLCLIHGLGPECIPRAIGVVAADQDNDGNDAHNAAENFQRECNRKARKAQDAAQDPNFCSDVVVGTWGSEALEKLNNALQHAEEAGKCLLEATSEKGPVRAAERELTRRALSSPTTSWPLSFLVHHYENDPHIDALDFEDKAFGKVVGAAAQLWSRITIVMEESPFLFARFKDPTLSDEERSHLRQRILTQPLCEFDAPCGRVIRDEVVFGFVIDWEGGSLQPAMRSSRPASSPYKVPYGHRAQGLHGHMTFCTFAERWLY